MKITTTVEKEVDVKTLHVNAGVRYWEDATVNGIEDEIGDLIPFREGDNWKPVIDLETGKIIDWPEGTTAAIHYKVCDDGIYILKDADGQIVSSINNDYVPSILCPKENGYGDYIIMDVNEYGLIEGFKPNLSEFK